MGEFIKVIGCKMSKMDMELKNFPTKVFSKGSILKVNLVAMELIYGVMDRDTMVSGLMDISMDQACGEVRKEIPIKDSGNFESLMVMEFIHGQMETLTKDNLKIV
jgi:hypothetical protein